MSFSLEYNCPSLLHQSYDQVNILTDADIAHYQKIIVALHETIRIMAEIDETIETHGGWPDAFITDPPEK